MQKIICITGATAGFGQATARRFAQDGWKIIATGRRQERLDALAKELGEENCYTMCLDVRDREAVAASFAALPADFAEVDVLVNNAGLALGLEPAYEASLDDWDTMIDTNIKGLTYCTRTLLPAMVERGRGHVVNLGSIAGSYPYPGGNVYGGTKAFVLQFSQNLRCDLHGTGVRVTNIEPGLCESEFSIVRFKGDTSKSDSLYAGADPILPDNIADIIHYAVNSPAHINIDRIEIMATSQSCGPTRVARK